MAEVVQEISPVANLSQFYEMMFGTQTGYVYAPIKELHIRPERTKPRFIKHFFQWPEQKDELIQHTLTSSVDHEVYYSPALWNSPALGKQEITPEHFKGTYWVWVDFDYGLPTKEQLEGLPEPTVKVQSSYSSKEHWYWKLEFFNTEKDILEDFCKRVTFKLDGDPSGWDYVQVLRPPGTVNHKGGKKRVTLLQKNNGLLSVTKLAMLPAPPTDTGLVTTVDTNSLPDLNSIIFGYKWPPDAADLFKKKLEQLNIKKGRTDPDRSGALMRLAFECAEMGMNNQEMFVILQHADARWKKFVTNVNNPDKAYIKMINKARILYPISEEGNLEAEIQVYGFNSFLAAKIEMEWVIEGLLQAAGCLVLSSPPGIGKTQFSLWIAMHIALGKEVMGWTVKKPLRIMFWSMEMGYADLKWFVSQMAENFTTEERLVLEENLLLVPLGYSILLDKPANQAILLNYMDIHKPDGVMFDSLGVAIGDEISSDKVINDTFDFLNKQIRTRRKCFVWFLHHNRKAQAGNSKPKLLADLYGSQYIGSHANTVVGLWPLPSGQIEVNCLKLRVVKHFDSFRMSRTNPLGFKSHKIIAGEVEDDLAMVGASGDEDIDFSTSPGFELE